MDADGCDTEKSSKSKRKSLIWRALSVMLGIDFIRRIWHVFLLICVVFTIGALLWLFSDFPKNMNLIFAGFNSVNTETVTSYIERTNAINELRQLVVAERDFDGEIKTSNTSTTTILGLGLTTTEAREAIFNALTYYVVDGDRDAWEFEVNEGVLFVSAPEIKPLKTVVNTGSIRIKVDKNWLHLNAGESSEQLLHQLSDYADRSAAKPMNINLIRETARLSLTGFIRAWLKDYPLQGIRVKFADELEFPAIPILPDQPPPNAKLSL